VINLLPPDYPKPKTFSERMMVLIIIITSLTVIVFGSSFALGIVVEKKTLEKKMAVVEGKIIDINDQLKNLNKIEAKNAQIEERLTKLDQAFNQDLEWVIVLKELSNVIPNNTWLTRLDITEDRVFKIEGYILSGSKLKDIIKNSQKSKTFTNIDLRIFDQRSIHYSPDYEEAEGFYYEIDGTIDKSLDDNQSKDKG